MIDLTIYFKGRDIKYAEEMTSDILRNSEITVARVNELLMRAGRSDVHTVNSGWRPQGVNDATANAAKGSKHLSAEAVDLPDADRSLCGWAVDNLDILAEIGLWIEDPRWTPTWLHAQIVPPKSGKRVFIPSTAPASDPHFPVTWIA